MTWQDPGGNAGPGGAGEPPAGDPALDETRADWPAPQPPAGDPPPSVPPAGPPPVPSFASQPPSGGSYTPPPQGSWQQPGAPMPSGQGWAPVGGYAAPVAAAWRFAGVGERFVAWFLDQLIIFVIMLPVGFVISILTIGSLPWGDMFRMSAGGTVPGMDPGVYGVFALSTLLSAGLSALINAAYFVLQWSSGNRATLGMRALGLEIGDATDGHTLPRGQALRRWFAMGDWLGLLQVVPVLGGLAGFVLLIWDLILLIGTASNPQRRGPHDQFANTSLVAPAGRSNSGIVTACLVLIVIAFVVLPIVAIFALISLGTQVSEILMEVGNSV